MRREWLWRVLLVAPALCLAGQAAAATPKEDKEPAWGRIYLRNGLAPIQYFRDSFGGDMVRHEVEFYFPKSRLGCDLLSFDEQEAIKASNGTAVMVVDRGECTFETKSRVAQSMGAAGLVVVSATEEVRGPAAIIEGDEEDEEASKISIPSVMIRRSAGEMLRAVAAANQRAFGWLMPMVCQLHPYKCSPRSAEEKAYISEATARGGVINIASSGSQDGPIALGTFLTSAFGGTLPTSKAFELAVVADASQACADQDEPSGERSMEGKAALVTARTGPCSLFEQVSSAQRAGAAVAILAMAENETAMGHPSTTESWLGYNITMPSVSVSSATAASLQRLARKSAVRFLLHNQIADDWEQIRKLALHTAWPVRKERREKLARSLLAELSVFRAPDRATAVKALERQFLRVGGSVESWRRLIGEGDQAAENDASAGMSNANADVGGGGKASSHEEL